jgi:hypothetical protein
MRPFAQIECSTSGHQAARDISGVRQDRTIDKTVSFRNLRNDGLRLQKAWLFILVVGSYPVLNMPQVFS